MRKTFCASVLVLALCGSAFAGDIGCPPITAPSDIETPLLAAGDIECPPSTTQSFDDQTADGFAEAVLNVLNSVLALL
jgi:hypothetical protein